MRFGKPYECKNISNKRTIKRIDTLEVWKCVTEDFQLEQVQQNQYSSLY